MSQCPYCNKKYRSSTWYRNHIGKQHPDFVRPPQAVQETIGDRVQPPNPFPEANETHELHNSIEIQVADYESESDHSIADLDIESLNLFERGDCLADFVESRAPTKHHTAGRALRDAVQSQKAEDELWAPFQNKTDFELAQWLIEAKVPKEHIDRYFKNGLRPENSTIKSAYRRFRTIDELELGLGMRSWKEGMISFTELVSVSLVFKYCVNQVEDIEDAHGLELATSQQRFFYRNPLDCVKYLRSQRCFAQDIGYAAVKDWDSETPPTRVYSEMNMGDWWWETQDSLPEVATIVPMICSADVTFLTNLSGDKKAWPIYLTIGEVAEVGIEIECAYGKVPQCFPHLAAWIADHLENVTLHGIQQNLCAVGETTTNRSGAYTGRSAAIGDYKKYQTLCAEYSEGSSDAGEDLINHAFKLHPRVFWSLPDVHQAHLPKPDILHVVYLGIFETHLMKWIIGFLKKYKRLQAFDAIWKNLPAYPSYPTEAMIQYLEQYLKAFHGHEDVFKEYRKDKSTARKVTQRRHIALEERQELEGVVADIYDEDVDFNFVKIHLLSHFAEHKRRFGNIQTYSTESEETSLKIMIKEGYRRSNKNDAS
ncbi:hypothetical protein HOY80DRAFT_1097389 [Tuber brumale]|nr:hypothetical protein HOY80DRAFT_1097389 [Tuber brumale]